MSPHRVTVIDDSPELLAVVGEALRDDGVDVTLFDRGATLGDIAESTADLLVVDLTLGTHSLPGWDLVESIRSHPDMRDMPIIVCSAALDRVQEHRDEIDWDPRTYLLLKPFSIDDLEAVLTGALGTKVGRPEGQGAAT